MAKSIDLKEEFPHLSKAPIVEAALEIRVVPLAKWDENCLRNKLKDYLPNFSKIEDLRQTNYKIPTAKPSTPIVEDFFIGFKLHSDDGLHIAQFNKEAFVFSRLKPYENWLQLRKEALRLWGVYCELLKPNEIKRIGLRFINRMGIKENKIELSDYYKYPPEPVKELDWRLTGYLYHDVLKIPETPYGVNLIKTVQPGEETGLILDIDVFMEDAFEYNESHLKKAIEEMRWVKNKIFFSNLTDKTVQELK